MEAEDVAYTLNLLFVFDDGTVYSLSQSKAIRGPAKVGGGRLGVWEEGVSRECSIPNGCSVWRFEMEETCLSQGEIGEGEPKVRLFTVFEGGGDH